MPVKATMFFGVDLAETSLPRSSLKVQGPEAAAALSASPAPSFAVSAPHAESAATRPRAPPAAMRPRRVRREDRDLGMSMSAFVRSGRPLSRSEGRLA